MAAMHTDQGLVTLVITGSTNFQDSINGFITLEKALRHVV